MRTLESLRDWKVWKISPLFIFLKASLNDWESVILYFRMPPSSRKRSHNHINYDSDNKVIPFNKCYVNHFLEEEVNTIKIVNISSPVTERVMCDIYSADDWVCNFVILYFRMPPTSKQQEMESIWHLTTWVGKYNLEGNLNTNTK